MSKNEYPSISTLKNLEEFENGETTTVKSVQELMRELHEITFISISILQEYDPNEKFKYVFNNKDLKSDTN